MDTAVTAKVWGPVGRSGAASGNAAGAAGDWLVAAKDGPLLTDLYQFTMAACYGAEGLDDRPAAFELFARRLPVGFGYAIAMGLEQAIAYLETFEILPEQVAALRSTGIFERVPEAFWQRLTGARFTGDVWAVPEGTAVLPQEPLLRVEAPLWQAQVVETFLLNAINYQTLVATRAARLRDVAGDRAVLLEFGTRRAFGPQAAVLAARSAIAGGLDATSNVWAALQLGRRPSGTMAHALVMAIAALEGDEMAAFAAFQRSFPESPLLIDTYDAIAAADRLADGLAQGTISQVPAVRLDSGDLLAQAIAVKERLPNAKVFASGDLDETAIAALVAAGAPIDGYGVGTKLVTGEPFNGVYKLVEIDGKPVMKESPGKVAYPGRKQIFRRRDRESGAFLGDRLGLAIEEGAGAADAIETPLLVPVMAAGKRLLPPEDIDAIAARSRSSVLALPAELRHPTAPEVRHPAPSAALEQLVAQTRRRPSPPEDLD
jgi:nicotinate phosphoribosyltransferase